MLSKKKQKAIKEIGTKCLIDVLSENHLGSYEKWWEDQPETWTSTEREHFDALSELQDRIIEGVLAILSKQPPSTPSI